VTACEDSRVRALRKAASAIVGRDGEDGLDVLVLERGANSRFLAGYVAFPGGSTDEGDAELSRRWFGSDAEADRACAVRELVEEVGLALTSTGLHAADGDGLGRVSSSPPTTAQLPEVAHWVAPPEVPTRFDARFFAVRGEADVAAVADGVETADAWWISPRGLLEDWRTGRRRLYWPTYFTVLALSSCATVDDLLQLRIATREPDADEIERLPRSTFWQS
jgi:8-oxo-dGTP pyrophosphatase MutT (NUDIX family)